MAGCRVSATWLNSSTAWSIFATLLRLMAYWVGSLRIQLGIGALEWMLQINVQQDGENGRSFAALQAQICRVPFGKAV